MITATGASITGQKRATNQDAFVVDNRQKLWIVADGMGGHAAGEKAAQRVCERLPQILKKENNTTDALHVVHQEIVNLGREQQALSGMGATVIVAQQTSTQLNIYWVGDCRAFTVNDGHLTAITKDHSHVQQLVELGLLEPQQAQNHPMRHIVTQCIGGNKTDNPQIGFTSIELNTMQQVLLCSDGLYNDVSELDMLALIVSAKNQQSTIQKLLEKADNNGGNDNATAILLNFTGSNTENENLPLSLKSANHNTNYHMRLAAVWLKMKTWFS